MDIKYIIIIAVVFLFLVIAGLAIVNFSTEEMYEKYKKISNLPCGLTPVELANTLNTTEFGNRIHVVLKKDLFCDSLSSNGVLTLCSTYANENNMAGLAICAHELGHAFQFRDKMQKMNSHAGLLKTSKIFSWLFSPLVILGIVALLIEQTMFGYGLFIGAGVSFLIAVVAKFSTIGIEKEASNNALEILRVYASFTDDELKIAKRFLNSAKMTYVADLLKIMLKWTMLVRK